ncbi:MAG: radical SAM family heme chaperone HemW [Fimbriimonadaceae bacterium]
MNPIAVYIHVPFCPSKCGYCDFNSFALEGDVIPRTVDATETNIRRSAHAGRPCKTVFFGGGTPTLLPAADLARILRAVLATHPGTEGLEVTTECNPGTVDLSKFAELRAAGFDRVSIGAQSFQSHDLVQLGRVHGTTQTLEAVRAARRAGFERLNLDLMFGLPGQSMRGWRQNLEQALDLGPDHLSLYCLTIEPNTRFYRYWSKGMLDLPDESLQVEMYDAAVEACALAGLWQYEISNFARPGEECRHNLAYWRGEEYEGYGPGAVGCVRSGEFDWPRRRTTRTKHPARFSDEIEAGSEAVCEEETLDEATGTVERIMLGIRLNEGIASEGLPARGIEQVVSRGWAVDNAGRVALTPSGRHFCNEVAATLV